MAEGNIQSNVLKYLNSLPNCIAENVSGNADQAGRSDINGCYNGKCFKIELKDPSTGYKPSKRQILYLKKWENAGALVGIAYSIEDVQEILGIK